MKTIILPGYSVKNKEWAEEVKNNLDLNHKILVHNWQHWNSGNFSPSKERSNILKNIRTEKINVLAKSVGTRVLMHLLPEIFSQVNKIILCGIPTRFESETPKKLYKSGLSLLSSSQIIIFQNERDPLANYSVIEKFTHSVDPKIKVIKKPRSDHHYPYFEDFQDFLL